MFAENDLLKDEIFNMSRFSMAISEKKEKLINKLKEFFQEKAASFSIEMVFLYGSWAKGFPKDDSDLDLALVFSEEKTAPAESFKRITDISVWLENILKKEINIIEIRKEFDKPMLYYNAIIHGVPIYISDFNSYLKLRNEAIFQMEDFSIFGLSWQYEAARKNLEAIESARI